MKLELIEGWKKWYKFWSTQIGMLGASVVTFLTVYPDIATTLWGLLPAEIKAAIPPQYMPLIGVVIVLVSLFAKFVVQHKLRDEIKDGQA